jgi:hypothetical protein
MRELSHFSIFAICLFSGSLHAATCPNAPGETTLSLTAVMDDFRDLLWSPDQDAEDGSNIADSVSDADLASAIASLSTAIDCANQVINNPTPILQPDGAKAKTGQDRANYLKQFYDDFTQLRDALVTYQTLFQQVSQTPMSTRNFTAIHNQELVIRGIEVDAHSHF